MFFMPMLNREVYVKVKKSFLKLKQPCIEKHRPGTKCPPHPYFQGTVHARTYVPMPSVATYTQHSRFITHFNFRLPPSPPEAGS